MKDTKKTVLKVMPIPEVFYSEYQYFVDTPENDTFYFSDKKKANQFIELYNEHHDRLAQKNCTKL